MGLNVGILEHIPPKDHISGIQNNSKRHSRERTPQKKAIWCIKRSFQTTLPWIIHVQNASNLTFESDFLEGKYFNVPGIFGHCDFWKMRTRACQFLEKTWPPLFWGVKMIFFKINISPLPRESRTQSRCYDAIYFSILFHFFARCCDGRSAQMIHGGAGISPWNQNHAKYVSIYLPGQEFWTNVLSFQNATYKIFRAD